MRVLILLTDSYPYGQGEDFLQNELPYAGDFERIYLCPLSPNSRQRTKEIPAQAEIVETGDLPPFSPTALLNSALLAEALRTLPDLRKTHEALFSYKKAVQKAACLLARLPDLRDCDVTLYSYWLNTGAMVAARLKRLLPCRSILTISRAHRYDLYAEQAKLGFLPFRRYLLNTLDAVYPCSQNGTDYLASRYPRYAGKLSTARLGTPDCGQKSGVQAPLHIVSCSSLTPVKRVSLLIDALGLLDLPVRWTHLGGGGLYTALTQSAARLPSGVQWRFAGQLSNREILDFYRQNDVSVFLNVSASEGLPVSIMEACSFGLPVVATDVGGSRELVETDKNGVLLPPDPTARQIADAIRKLATMPEQSYQTLCRNARAAWKAGFTAERNFTKFYADNRKKERNR